MRRRGLGVALSLVVLVPLASCVPAFAANVGVEPGPDGTARILFVSCEDAGVTSVQLETFGIRGDPPRPIWRIRSARPSGAEVFTVGRTPVGFREVVPMRRALPPLRRLYASVGTTAGPYGIAFRPLDLRPGLVLRPDAAVPKEEFSRSACEGFGR